MTEVIIHNEPLMRGTEFTAVHCFKIFDRSVIDYHNASNTSDIPLQSPFQSGTVSHALYIKNWIDDMQWHLEDISRYPNIEPSMMVAVKRKIDFLNQERVSMVEALDNYLIKALQFVPSIPGAKVNSETPGSIIDRMSILALKIYHMEERTKRSDVDTTYIVKCSEKLAILTEQKIDIANSFDELIFDLVNGSKKLKAYRQIKIYNDHDINPILYKENNKYF